jgi:hypothetical protein
MRLNYTGFSLSHLSSGKNLDSVASMRVMIIMRERKRRLAQDFLPERVLNNKLDAYKFVDRLGIRRPRLISGKARHDALPAELNNLVIKPLSGKSSQGVYAAFNENAIQKIKTAERFSGRDALIAHLKEDMAAGINKEDRWIIEELITEESNPLTAARDLKFYCFYGRVELVLEIVRDPVTRYCFWDKDGKLKNVGGFEDRLFEGRGFTPEMLKTAERISAEIPAPFMRIDFHNTGSELVFCEFTPTSGAIWDYGRETDQFLGERYLEAEARLLGDLLSGKRFTVYNSLHKRYVASRKSTASQKPVAELA